MLYVYDHARSIAPCRECINLIRVFLCCKYTYSFKSPRKFYSSDDDLSVPTVKLTGGGKGGEAVTEVSELDTSTFAMLSQALSPSCGLSRLSMRGGRSGAGLPSFEKIVEVPLVLALTACCSRSMRANATYQTSQGIPSPQALFCT